MRMTGYKAERDRLASGPLSELLQVPDARVAPMRCRYANGTNYPMTLEESRRAIAMGVGSSIFHRKKREK